MDIVGEHISYNIWRSTLRPLGSIGRIREYVYEASASTRRKMNGL